MGNGRVSSGHGHDAYNCARGRSAGRCDIRCSYKGGGRGFDTQFTRLAGVVPRTHGVAESRRRQRKLLRVPHRMAVDWMRVRRARWEDKASCELLAAACTRHAAGSVTLHPKTSSIPRPAMAAVPAMPTPTRALCHQTHGLARRHFSQFRASSGGGPGEKEAGWSNGRNRAGEVAGR